MKTIVVTSQKGGSGKTMLAAHLAVEAERAGDKNVWVIDTDAQATLTRWHERRDVETPQRGEVRIDRLESGLQKLAQQGASFCFIDTAPTISDQTERLISLADLVVIPVRPSPSDLWSVADTVEKVKDAGKPFLFVITQAKPQALITAQAVATLSKDGRIARAFIADRVIYAAAMTGGNTATEVAPRNPAAAEIEELWSELKSCFAEKLKTTRKVANG